MQPKSENQVIFHRNSISRDAQLSKELGTTVCQKVLSLKLLSGEANDQIYRMIILVHLYIVSKL